MPKLPPPIGLLLLLGVKPAKSSESIICPSVTFPTLPVTSIEESSITPAVKLPRVNAFVATPAPPSVIAELVRLPIVKIRMKPPRLIPDPTRSADLAIRFFSDPLPLIELMVICPLPVCDFFTLIVSALVPSVFCKRI